MGQYHSNCARSFIQENRGIINKVIKLQCFYTCFGASYMSKRHRSVCNTPGSQNISSNQICDFTTNYIQICSGLELARTEIRGQGHSDLETVGDSPGPKMYLHTKYETAIINNIVNLLWVHFSRTDS